MSLESLTRNAVDVLPAGGLAEKLKLGRPLRVKLGIDPSRRPTSTSGVADPAPAACAAFQDAGHVGVLIVGDYTTRIGDPSGRSQERPMLADEEIDAEREDSSSSRRSDPRPASEPRSASTANGSASSSFAEIVRLTRTMTVAQLLERDDFAKRFAAREPISLSELLYPLMQAYDSVAVEPTSSSAAPTSSTTCSPGAT